jgi:hypothetical protein
LDLAGGSGEELWAVEAPLTAKGRATARMSAWEKGRATARVWAWAKAKELASESETAGEAANRLRK